MRVIGSDHIRILLLCGIVHYTKKTTITHMMNHDENEPDSPTDDLVAIKGNEKLLDQSKIIKDLSDFLEIGMKYKINVEIKENKYCLEN